MIDSSDCFVRYLKESPSVIEDVCYGSPGIGSDLVDAHCFIDYSSSNLQTGGLVVVDFSLFIPEGNRYIFFVFIVVVRIYDL